MLLLFVFFRLKLCIQTAGIVSLSIILHNVTVHATSITDKFDMETLVIMSPCHYYSHVTDKLWHTGLENTSLLKYNRYM